MSEFKLAAGSPALPHDGSPLHDQGDTRIALSVLLSLTPDLIQHHISTLPLSALAVLIEEDWGRGPSGVGWAARPYLDAMQWLDSIDDSYGWDDGRTVVLYWLSNAQSYRGLFAQCAKAELRRRLKTPRIVKH